MRGSKHVWQRAVLALTLGAALSAGRVAVQAQQEQRLFISLTDQSGIPVTDLKAEEVTVMEDGQRRDTVGLEPINWPMKLTVLVDNGPGATAGLVELRGGLRGFFDEVPADVEVSLLTITPQPRWVVRPTTSREEVLKGIDLVAPDSGAARFIDAVAEAAERIDRDKSDHFPVIVLVATDGAEGSSARERDIERLVKRIQENAATVHVAMLSLGGQRASIGGRQVQLGLFLTEATGGRYESFAAGTRLTTLLPELGRQIARSHERQRHQYRITYRRPAGVGAPSQGISATTSRSGVQGTMSLDGHIPQP